MTTTIIATDLPQHVGKTIVGYGELKESLQIQAHRVYARFGEGLGIKEINFELDKLLEIED